MEKNESANKQQDFAEGIVDPKTAKAVAGGWDETAWGQWCPNCYKKHFPYYPATDENGNLIMITRCCGYKILNWKDLGL